MKQYLLIYLLLLAVTTAAQTKDDAERNRLIAASQEGASPLFFTVDAAKVPLVSPEGFTQTGEYTLRNGLPHFFKKAAAGQPLRVGFIGGSITQGSWCYRLQTMRYVQSMFPAVTMKGINAGVSGTGTDLGACRLKEQLLIHHPDLVFIEFAANGAYTDGMEGIIRQIRRYDPAIDICLIYTIYNGQTKIYAADSIPENIQGLEKIAAYYQLPSVQLGMQASLLEKEGKLVWKGDTAQVHDRIVFSADGIHPLAAGGNLYAEAIARAFDSMRRMSISGNQDNSTLPAPLIADNWEDAGMYDPQQLATFSKDWLPEVTAGSRLQQFKGWFPYVMKAEQPGASFTFRFKGNMFGFFDIGGPEMGQLTIEVDGKAMQVAERGIKGTRLLKAVDNGGNPLINRFNNYCNNRYRGQHELITVEPGNHTVTIRLSADKADKHKILGNAQLEDITAHPDKYDRTVAYIGKILLRGTPLPQ
ncbi:SGNH/GDSL hydrolase family protein [Chitinophaga agrisoli]|uniref:SGNH/GDSL hydrolase family protein n=1 Tax=Chitinophaga agrisoli TaxID=2607653 RepID=A0A5B2VU24_9BACT|nr:SGNH/GDSL hydrolase family protein [Chitinophaga agrisoli]KAA2243303.1 SGNH/GDSL hydrolase family protein [Chitinophaga agrisoli]